MEYGTATRYAGRIVDEMIGAAALGVSRNKGHLLTRLKPGE
jgi:hypothetical protein